MSENALSLGVPTAPLPRPRSLLLAAVALVAALFALQMGGLELGLLPRGTAAPVPGAGVPAPDAGAEAAAHAARASKVGPAAEAGVLEARDPAYRARFDRGGFSYLPAGASAPLRLDLAGVTVGGGSIALERHAWTSAGSAVERAVAPSVHERVTARDGEVEWDVVLDRALPGTGDLVVRGDLSGAVADPVVRKGLVEVPVAGGAVARIGSVVVKDAGGAVLHRALPVVTGDSIELVVPAAALAGARYPVTIDPSVSGQQTLAPAGLRFEPAMAWSGASNGTHLVVWQEYVAGQYDIYGAVISDDGVGRTSPRQLSFATTGDSFPDVAWNGSNFLVVFEEQYPPNPSDVDIRGQLVDKNGNLIGGTIPIATSSAGQGQPAITATSTGFTIAWNDDRNGTWDIYAGRYTTSGSPLDGQGLRLSDDSAPFNEDEFYPDVAWNGSTTLVAWESHSFGRSAIETVRMFPDGQVEIQHNGTVPSTGHSHLKPALAPDGAQWLLVYEDKTLSTGAVDLYDFIVDANDFHDPAVPFATAAGNEGDASIAYDGGYYLVAYTDRRFTGDPDVRAWRVDGSGAKVGSDSFIVDGATTENDLPTVAPGRGSGWAVAYENGTGPQTAITWRSVSK